MSNDLFDDPGTGLPDNARVTMLLTDAYARELLADPPIRSVSLDNTDRQRNARKFAAKDVARLLRAMAEAGLTVTETAHGKEVSVGLD
jgi:hypothetical protein